jgi:CelD/BcsL family acetyltransferase involved in cellulose biosynthesis
MRGDVLTLPAYRAMADRRALTVTVARTAAGAARHRAAWQDLAQRADANAFYEPWCLLPALEQFGLGREMRVVFVQDAGRLLGVFPMELRSRFHGLPLRHLVAWRHAHQFLAAPLVDRDCAGAVWRRFLAWARGEGACFVGLAEMPSDGVSGAALRAEAGQRVQVADQFTRAMLMRDAASAEDYLAQSASAGSRKDWRRLMRRLSEQGALQVRSLQAGEDAVPWIEGFLTLEAAGWKGRDGTALANDPAAAAFFRTMAMGAHGRGALHMAGLFMDGQPVALQCNLFAGGEGFAFKVAFDEAWAAFSPGVLLEVEAIRDVYARPGFTSMDACTGRDHPLMGRLWRGTRRIDHLRVATNLRGAVVLALLAWRKGKGVA